MDSTVNSALGGQTLLPGIYTYHSGVSLNGILTLNGTGNSSAIFVFQIATTLLVASGSSMVLINGANACNVYFAVGMLSILLLTPFLLSFKHINNISSFFLLSPGSSATLGTNSASAGKILAYSSISVTTGASNQGGLYAGAAITLQTNNVAVKNCV